MRCDNLRSSLNRTTGTVTVADHLFDIDLTPNEALALLDWLGENATELKIFQAMRHERTRRLAPRGVERGLVEHGLRSELLRRGYDPDAADFKLAESPSGIADQTDSTH